MKIEFTDHSSKHYFGDLEEGQVFGNYAPYESPDEYDIYLKVFGVDNLAIRLVDGRLEEFGNWVEVRPLNARLVIE